MFKKMKKPLLFAVAMIPIAAIGGIFTVIYSFNTYQPAVQQEILTSAGSYTSLILGSALQSVIIAVICSVLGYILSDKIGLMRPFKFEKKSLRSVCIATVIGGVLFSLDYLAACYQRLRKYTKRRSRLQISYHPFYMAVL